MWPFTKAKLKSQIEANSIVIENGEAVIDVCGQTCPGYLLAINKAVNPLKEGTKVKLLISYPPCGEDVKAWCNEKAIKYIGLHQEAEKIWIIEIQK